MYMNRLIKVNLTKENAEKLEKPSKIFNKIKATFSGGMTPAETERAEVMLSVLQRVNKSLRAANICNLVSLTVNDYLVYQDRIGIKDDLQEGISSFIHDKNTSNIKVFKDLKQVVAHTSNEILFVYDINVIQKPKKGEFPVTITVSGFPSQFKLGRKENIDDFESRITTFVKENLNSDESIKLFNEKCLSAFDVEVDRYTVALEQLFPAGCSSQKYKVRLLSKDDQKKLKKRIGSSFESDILFMHYWLNAKTVSNFDDDLFDVDVADCFDEFDCLDNVQDSGSQSSWIDGLSDFFSNDSSSDSGSCSSSCGSSCGGSCGD